MEANFSVCIQIENLANTNNAKHPSLKKSGLLQKSIQSDWEVTNLLTTLIPLCCYTSTSE